MGFTLVVSDVYSVFVRFLYEYLFGVSDAGGIDGISFLVSWAPSLPCVILHVCKSVCLSVCRLSVCRSVGLSVCRSVGLSVCLSMSTYVCTDVCLYASGCLCMYDCLLGYSTVSLSIYYSFLLPIVSGR